MRGGDASLCLPRLPSAILVREPTPDGVLLRLYTSGHGFVCVRRASDRRQAAGQRQTASCMRVA